MRTALDASDADRSDGEGRSTDETSERSGPSSEDVARTPHHAWDSASAYFRDMVLHRNCRRRGIMIVRTQSESLSTKAYERSVDEYHQRRTLRWRQSPPVRSGMVRFDALTIHEFPMILGDNPACLAGPPLSISWEPQGTTSLTVDEFESTRPPRRLQAQMIVPAAMRLEILRRTGYARNEIIALTKPVNIDRSRRRSSKEMQNLDKVNELTERVLRASRHVVTLGYIKRRERKFLEPFVTVTSFTWKRRGDLSHSISSTMALEVSEEMAH